MKTKKQLTKSVLVSVAILATTLLCSAISAVETGAGNREESKQPTSPVRISGIVQGEKGAPVANAIVILASDPRIYDVTD